jgi:hypothetical protein
VKLVTSASINTKKILKLTRRIFKSKRQGATEGWGALRSEDLSLVHATPRIDKMLK